jgi:hypothetical protein
VSALDVPVDHVRCDEACATGYQNLHRYSFAFRFRSSQPL